MNNEQEISKAEANTRINELKGEVVSHVWRGHGSSLFLELGKLENNSKTNNPQGEQTVIMEWSWRVEETNSIVAGSWSDNNEIDDILVLLKGKTIEDVAYFGRLSELSIKLSENLWLLSFMTEKGDPEWAIKFRNKEYLKFCNGSFKIEPST